MPRAGHRREGTEVGMSKRILIVDDSSMMRKLIKRVLTSRGHRVVGEAKNGVEALKLYQELAPDLVTMDITMAEMDGLTAAEAILDFDGAAHILFLSNRDETKLHDVAARLGGLKLVNKHKTDELLKIIDDLPG